MRETAPAIPPAKNAAVTGCERNSRVLTHPWGTFGLSTSICGCIRVSRHSAGYEPGVVAYIRHDDGSLKSVNSVILAQILCLRLSSVVVYAVMQVLFREKSCARFRCFSASCILSPGCIDRRRYSISAELEFGNREYEMSRRGVADRCRVCRVR